MRKILTLLILVTVIQINYANPIPVPTIEISELYFDASGEWTLELVYYEMTLIPDSIKLFSTEDTVNLPPFTFPFNNNVEFLLITNDILPSDFNINRYGDTIKLVSYIYGDCFEDVLIFGNSVGAVINYPRPGQSISKFSQYFVKDNSPTIGSSNDTSGMCGTIKGIIYDKYSIPVSERQFYMDYIFETTDNGEYSTRVYAKPACFNRLLYEAGQHSTMDMAIIEISYVMEPDSVIERDINLLDTLASGLMNAIQDMPVKVYPNPVSTSEKIMIAIDLPVKTSDIRVELVSIEGKLIRTTKVSEMQIGIETPDKKGLYVLNVWLDNQIISSKPILVN
jgi:hypothetical protein